MELKIGNTLIGDNHPTYFVADIAANHDGSLERARKLIRQCAEAGANAANFQNIRGPQIVSDYGFTHMQSQVSHQAKWRKSVVEVYNDASLPLEWTPILSKLAMRKDDYISAPYILTPLISSTLTCRLTKSARAISLGLKLACALQARASQVLLATGASDIGDVQRAVDAILAVNPQLVLIACNTNYTADPANFDHIQLECAQNLS
jgi:N-acetylneuraminate synthase